MLFEVCDILLYNWSSVTRLIGIVGIKSALESCNESKDLKLNDSDMYYFADSSILEVFSSHTTNVYLCHCSVVCYIRLYTSCILYKYIIIACYCQSLMCIKLL